MPRPKVDRVARSMRLRAATDTLLVLEAEKLGISINEAVEAAVWCWLDQRSKPSRLVEPRFKR